MALTARSLQKLENQYRQRLQASQNSLDQFVVEQQQLWGSPNAYVQKEHHLAEYTSNPKRKHNHFEANVFQNHDSFPKLVPWLPSPPVRRSPPKGHRKRPYRDVPSNSSLIELAPRDLSELDHNIPGSNKNVPPTKVDGRRTKNYEKRARYKMREKTANTERSPAQPKERRIASTKTRKKGHNEARIPRNRSDILAERFSSEHVANPRITLRPSHRLGIFKKGRESGHTVPDLSFSEMPFLQGKPPLDIGAYDDSHGGTHDNPPRRSIQPVVLATKSPPRTPPADKLSTHISTKSIAVDPRPYIAELGPYDSVSQVCVRPRIQVLDMDSWDERSEYSKLGYQSRYLDPQNVNSVRLGARSSASLSVEKVSSEPMALDGGQAEASPQSRSSAGVAETREASPMSEEKIPTPNPRPPPDVPSDDSLDPLEQILRLCESSPQSTAPRQNNKVKPCTTERRDPASPRICVKSFHQSGQTPPPLDIPDELQGKISDEGKHPSDPQAMDDSLPRAPDDLIEFDNVFGTQWRSAYDDQFVEDQRGISEHPSMMENWEPELTNYEPHNLIPGEIPRDDWNDDLYQNSAVQVTPSVLSLRSRYNQGSEPWTGDLNVLPETDYFDANFAVEDVIGVGNVAADYRGVATGDDELSWSNDFQGMYPYQVDQRGTDLSVPKNFWRPNRLN
ncbi:hypothetical protein EX30DRAFT_395277 [Ascodesmis nigricans]|uniref:Uncharacterized protein n=1 Tax=Ascodesmis nigricans TaxID=341454 RepID=A0A4S2MYP0_9PEZI|nr:hypothetical protein EX30DRAFT_395277 [Ascodesmis nigricans]